MRKKGPKWYVIYELRLQILQYWGRSEAAASTFVTVGARGTWPQCTLWWTWFESFESLSLKGQKHLLDLATSMVFHMSSILLYSKWDKNWSAEGEGTGDPIEIESLLVELLSKSGIQNKGLNMFETFFIHSVKNTTTLSKLHSTSGCNSKSKTEEWAKVAWSSTASKQLCDLGSLGVATVQVKKSGGIAGGFGMLRRVQWP